MKEETEKKVSLVLIDQLRQTLKESNPEELESLLIGTSKGPVHIPFEGSSFPTVNKLSSRLKNIQARAFVEMEKEVNLYYQELKESIENEERNKHQGGNNHP